VRNGGVGWRKTETAEERRDLKPTARERRERRGEHREAEEGVE
jgi:hypothetical protein